MMTRNTTSSTFILFLEVIVLFLALSPAANCFSLDDRLQLKKLTEDFVS